METKSSFSTARSTPVSGELNELAVFQLGDVDLRLTDNLQVLLANDLVVAGRNHVVEHLLQDWAAAEAGLNQLCRRLALTEARNLDLLSQCLVGVVELWLQLVKRDLDGNLHSGLIELLNGRLHWCTLLQLDD